VWCRSFWNSCGLHQSIHAPLIFQVSALRGAADNAVFAANPSGPCPGTGEKSSARHDAALSKAFIVSDVTGVSQIALAVMLGQLATAPLLKAERSALKCSLMATEPATLNWGHPTLHEFLPAFALSDPFSPAITHAFLYVLASY
jgi:hypothetical protein